MKAGLPARPASVFCRMAVTGFRAPDRTKRKSQHAEERFAENAAAHLRGALAAFDENDRHLLEFQSQPPCRVFHLDLEAVSLHLHGVEVDRLQRMARVADEPRRRIAQGHAGHDAYVHRSEVGHQQTRHRPVHDVHALHVTRTDHHVVPFGRSLVQPYQIVGIVREVAVHFADIVEPVVQSPAEPRQIGRAQPLLAAAFQQVQRRREFLLALFDDRCGAVGRTVVDDEHFESLGQREDLVDHRRNILFLVVCRDNYQFAHRGSFWNFLHKGNIILQICAARPVFLPAAGAAVLPGRCGRFAGRELPSGYLRRFMARIACLSVSLTRNDSMIFAVIC